MPNAHQRREARQARRRARLVLRQFPWGRAAKKALARRGLAANEDRELEYATNASRRNKAAEATASAGFAKMEDLVAATTPRSQRERA